MILAGTYETGSFLSNEGKKKMKILIVDAGMPFKGGNGGALTTVSRKSRRRRLRASGTKCR